MQRFYKRLAAVGLACVALLLAPAGVASGAENGLIAYGVDQGEETCDQCEDGNSVTEPGAAWVETVRPDGRQRRRVRCTTGSFSRCRDRDPAFSHDGRRLAIVGRRGLVIAAVDGRRLARLGDLGWSPAWGPRGRRLAYVDGVETPGGAAGTGVHVSDLRGRTRVVNHGGAVSVDWSRQGMLAWAAPFREWPDIWVGDADGRRERRVARAGDHPSWSPDGRRIAFVCRRGLCVVDRDGGNRRLITRACGYGPDLDATGVAWSPDGPTIACESRAGSLIAITLRPFRIRVVVSHRRFFNTFLHHIDWQPIPAR